MNNASTTVRSRELGRAMVRAARAKGMNGREVAVRLGWSDTKVSRMFAGKRRMDTEDVSAMLAVCGIAPPDRDKLMEMARHTLEPGWWQEFGDRVPPEQQALSDHEDAAAAIIDFHTDLVPGLLQTEDYMRALMRVSPFTPNDQIGTHVQVRTRRQWIFDRRWSAAKFRFFLDEYALTRTGPGREVMSVHVHHLLRMSVRPNVEIRIVPDAVGFHAGQKPFHFMEFTEFEPVVHIEDMGCSQFLERSDTIAGYRRVIAELEKVALDQEHSRSWMSTLATTLAHGDTSSSPGGRT